MLELKRWNTPTIYNGLEQYTRANRRRLVNIEETRDFMPQMGPMVGYAVTVLVEPGNPAHPARHPQAWREYRRYIASVPGPKIVVVQDRDKPRTYGTFWGEVNSNFHRALGCVGTICNGGIRDLDEMTNAGFKALARRLCVSHCFSHPVRWGCAVQVFGIPVQPGQLIHADKHGFLAVPLGEGPRLLEAARFMAAIECRTLIARATAGQPTDQILARFDAAAAAFTVAATAKFGRKGEWQDAPRPPHRRTADFHPAHRRTGVHWSGHHPPRNRRHSHGRALGPAADQLRPTRRPLSRAESLSQP